MFILRGVFQMHLSSFVLWLCVGAVVEYAAGSDGSDWCYTGCEHTPTHWVYIPGASCGGKRQSPVDIVTSHVKTDPNLHDFNLVNFSNPHIIKSIINTGHTVKCILEANVSEVSGGGLNGTYSTIQFHLHWGDTQHHPGSEHTVDGHRYPMEMHIVNLKKGLESPTEDPEGIVVLGFFLNATDDGHMTGPWGNLTSYLTAQTGTEVAFNHSISLHDLMGSVNVTKFYRYMGSLTTPKCNEAVVWTVFQEPININKDLIQKFPSVTGLSNVYRPTQQLNGRQVFASPGTPLPPSHPWCYDEHCDYSPSHWSSLPGSHCGGERQSPVNIKTEETVVKKELKEFKFKNFDDKHAIKYIINTGHTVKCVLKDDMVEVSEGDLGHDFATLQLHFHWGSTSDDSEGSEHTVDSHRYPMEMHIVNKRKDLSLEEAVKTPDGLAVLAFFLKASEDKKSSGGSEHHETEPSKPTSNMEAWKKLTSYLSHIKNISSKANVTKEISIDDLLGDVNRASYYRYNGSLTTPSCNEAVVWTVFKEPIIVDQSLMKMFPTNAGYHNVYRPVQKLHDRTVFSTTSASSSSAPTLLALLLTFLYVLINNLHFAIACGDRMKESQSRRRTGVSKVRSGFSCERGQTSNGICIVVFYSNLRILQMKWIVVAFALCAFVSTAHSAGNSVAWCYHLPTCNDTTWPVIATQFCNGTRQSPIDIVTASATANANLTAFTFTNYGATDGMTKIENTGKTIKVTLKSGLLVSGGALPEPFDSLQFHFHWGNGTQTPGSEHTVNGVRYPLELHIVNSKASLNGNTTLAVADSEGLAALGFFIEAMSGNSTGEPAAWKNLTSYLTSIPNQGDSVNIAPGFSLDDLLSGVDRTKYYRYLGSLTTPNCNEAVIWTVFKDTIKVSSDIIDLFGRTTRIGNMSTEFAVNTYRNVQPALPVTTQASSASKTCYSLGLMALGLALRGY
ncbi:uncharacterized protein LOC141785478 [Halichoeres trimaculatus]|uniref:uncharacterized protein LOC141785478 n=1 Tax=Halichoeres trimaculatus TaxID=147232 RepID=UPI003D9F182F